MEPSFAFSSEEQTGSGILMAPGRHEGCIEMIYILRGNVMVTTALCSFIAHAGELFFIPPDISRTVISNEEGAHLRSIRFSCSLFSNMEESVDNELFYMFLVQSRTKDNRILPYTPLYMPLRRYFEACYGEQLSKDLCYSIRIRGQLMMMMATLLHSYGTSREKDRVVYHNVLRLRPALDYIEENYSTKIGVAQLADLLMVTPDYFTKLFRDSIGKTTVDYINSVRINHAMILLRETTKPIASVATEVGLFSGNYFSKLFHRTLGITPLAFRKTKRE